ncbi:MAG: hypothetical protein ACP5G0_01380, partial [Desulfomonilia bacterium]
MRILRTLRRFFSTWRVYVGRNPHALPERSIILFPYQPCVLFCGLAGLLIIKTTNKHREEVFFDKFSRYTEAIRSNGIQDVISGRVSPEDYLSPTDLQKFENDLYTLKQDPSAQYQLCVSDGMDRLRKVREDLQSVIGSQEALLEDNADRFSSREIEIITSRLIVLKDISWGLSEDLMKNQDKILDLAGSSTLPGPLSFSTYQRINFCLNALDRLEVRGRDSSGVQIVIRLEGADALSSLMAPIKENGLYEEFIHRAKPGDLMNKSVHVSENSLIFTYKTAQVTGDLGVNTQKLRAFVQSDSLLRFVLESQAHTELFLAHTRWASVGAINEINAHPVNNFSVDSGRNGTWEFSIPLKNYPFYGKGSWVINVALNGDIDNYHSLKDSLEIVTKLVDSRVTTDTKVIPLQVERYLIEGHDLKEAFRRAVNDFEGSHAIAMESNLEPGKLFLALKGSGQSIYVGLCRNHYILSSEVYGLVEETPYFIKMDGENSRNGKNSQSQGQIFILRNNNGGGLKGIEAMYYDGYPLELSDSHIQKAEITTRDID